MRPNRSIFLKFFAVLVPIFMLAIGAGLHLISEHRLRSLHEQLAVRVGTQVALVAGLVADARIASEPEAASRYVRLLMSDRAIACVELRERGKPNLRIAVPRNVGCRVFDATQELSVPIPGSPGDELHVRISSEELAEARRDSRDFALAVMLGALLAAVAAGAVAFRYVVTRPLARLLSAIRKTAATKSFVTVDNRANDEIGTLVKAFNDMQRSLRHESERVASRTAHLQAIIDNFPGGIAFFDHKLRLVVCNDAAKRLLELPDQVFDRKLEDLIRFNARRGEFGPGDVEEQVAVRMAPFKEHKPFAFQRERPNGTVLDARCIPLQDGGYLTIYMDITERHRSQAKIAYMARHDPLTGLPNRVQLAEQMEGALAQSRRGEMFAIHLLDLDLFKNVNDTLGHPIGDQLLKMVAERLRAVVRSTDTIARMGGDEFAIIQGQIQQPSDAAYLAARVAQSVAKPYDVDGHRCVVGVSVGIAISPTHGTQPDTLMRNADLALYSVKGSKRGSFGFFEPAMEAQIQARHSLENDLHRVLAAGELELHYQPIFDLKNNAICAFEALVRWRHPQRGLILPAEFIPLAEEKGLSVPIGAWIARQACAVATTWPGQLRVAINVSPNQVKEPGFVQVIVHALAGSGLPAERLELEITETVLLEDTETTITALQQLRTLGVRISIDDFGAGYSSLSYLQRFPFDTIKIDQSFVSGTNDPAKSAKLVRAVAAMANDLGMVSIAEGVETGEQLESVRAAGCSQAQGYYLGKPLTSAEVERIVAEHREVNNAAAA
jgi:diguanylate cyclase (GGDEF)-like protein